MYEFDCEIKPTDLTGLDFQIRMDLKKLSDCDSNHILSELDKTACWFLFVPKRHNLIALTENKKAKSLFIEGIFRL